PGPCAPSPPPPLASRACSDCSTSYPARDGMAATSGPAVPGVDAPGTCFGMRELPGGPGVFVFCDFHAGVGRAVAVRSRLHEALVRPENGYVSRPQGLSTHFTFEASVLDGAIPCLIWPKNSGCS